MIKRRCARVNDKCVMPRHLVSVKKWLPGPPLTSIIESQMPPNKNGCGGSQIGP
jgi:hypothetical protein